MASVDRVMGSAAPATELEALDTAVRVAAKAAPAQVQAGRGPVKAVRARVSPVRGPAKADRGQARLVRRTVRECRAQDGRGPISGDLRGREIGERARAMAGAHRAAGGGRHRPGSIPGKGVSVPPRRCQPQLPAARTAGAELLQGMVATTAPNGAQSPAKADYGPIECRRVFVWPDADEPGAVLRRHSRERRTQEPGISSDDPSS